MNRRFYFSFLAFALAFAATVAFVIGASTSRSSAPNSALNALPASDFIVSIDVQRALSEMLPNMLASNPTMLSKLNANLEEFQQKTGINPRVFESVAIGGNLNQTFATTRRDSSSVIVARGSFKADELLNTGFAAAAKECTFDKEEQQYEGRTIFLVSNVRLCKKEYSSGTSYQPAQPNERFGDPRPSTNANTADTKTVIQGEARPAQQEKFAVAAVDTNTIAVGSPESVRAAIDASMGRNRVDDELVRLASQSPNAIVSFSGRVPKSVSDKQSGDNPFTRYFASIREFYGSFNAAGSEGESSFTLRTETTEQASDLSKAINSFKSLAAVGFASSKDTNSAEAKIVADLINTLSVTAQDNEVQINAKFHLPSIAPNVKPF
jgi:hypothetical protein